MPKKNSKISIMLDQDTHCLLKVLAKQKGQSLSHLEKKLIFEALDLFEDKVLSAIAEERDTENAKKIPFEKIFT